MVMVVGPCGPHNAGDSGGALWPHNAVDGGGALWRPQWVVMVVGPCGRHNGGDWWWGRVDPTVVVMVLGR